MVTTAQNIEGRNGEMKEREEKKMTFVDLARDTEIKNNGSGFPIIVRTEAHAGWSKGWLAKIFRENPNVIGGLEQGFEPVYEWDVNRRGNGYKYYKIRVPGVYQADTVRKSFTSMRVFFRVDREGNVKLIGCTAWTGLRELKRMAIEELKKLNEELEAAMQK